MNLELRNTKSDLNRRVFGLLEDIDILILPAYNSFNIIHDGQPQWIRQTTIEYSKVLLYGKGLTRNNQEYEKIPRRAWYLTR